MINYILNLNLNRKESPLILKLFNHYFTIQCHVFLLSEFESAKVLSFGITFPAKINRYLSTGCFV